ncbi:MAG: glutamate--tRNA ligase [Candidatus Paceibacterota bacterium]
MENKVITRFAPSPTGFMHVGNLRTALYAWLWAKKNNGTFILRIEDTDKEREIAGAIEHILKVLKWIGINWDEGPDIGGPHTPYTQSERLDLYKKYAQKLIDKGLAYPDPYTTEEVEKFRKQAEVDKKAFLYREHRPEKFDIWDGTKPLRFKVPEIRSYHWHDMVFGDLSAGPEALDDFILIKSDGFPTYNFCHIVDDIEMGITHVIRGQEYISSIPKFISLYEALESKIPLFVCLPHIMGKDGNKKLGKRDGAKDCFDYKEEGYLPEAMINFLALLGWHPAPEQSSVMGESIKEKEIFTVDELINAFEIERIQKSGAQWDDIKLDWINKEHIKKLSIEELEKYIFEFLPKEMQNTKLIPVITERISKFSDVKKMVETGELDFFFKEPIYNKEKLIYKNISMEKISANLKLAIDVLEKINENKFSVENIKNALMSIANNLENRGELLHPIRMALSGLDKSPDPFIIAEILGKNETLSRLQKGI